MKASSDAARQQPSPSPTPPPLRAVVVGSGLEASFRRPESASERAAHRLAQSLSLPHRPIGDPRAPHGQLGQLQASSGGWLASLPLDPGHPLEAGGSWAEALGAWRQPTLLIIAGQQLPSGAAAASVALLRQWRVPLLGVLQWGGSWNPAQRRQDGLPWLGRLEEASLADPDEDALLVAALLRRRWSCLDHPWSPGEAAGVMDQG
jgi:hypothetical protein